MSINVKGLVLPKVVVYDLNNLVIVKDQVVSLTTEQYNGSKDISAYVSAGLLSVVYDQATAPPSVLQSDVNPGTMMIRDGVVTPEKLSASLLALVSEITPKPTDLFWTTDPVIGADESEAGRISWGDGSLTYLGVSYALSSGQDTHDHTNPYTNDFTTPMVGVITIENADNTASLRFVHHPYSLQTLELAAVLYLNDTDEFISLQTGLSTKPGTSLKPYEVRTHFLQVIGPNGTPGDISFYAPNGYTGMLGLNSENEVFARPIGYNASDPTVSDDYSKGYMPTSMWVNYNTNQVFVCVKGFPLGPAVWKQITT